MLEGNYFPQGHTSNKCWSPSLSFLQSLYTFYPSFCDSLKRCFIVFIVNVVGCSVYMHVFAPGRVRTAPMLVLIIGKNKLRKNVNFLFSHHFINS